MNGKGYTGTVLWVLRQSYTLHSALSEIVSLVQIMFDSVAYDPVKTRLSELEAKEEEPTNYKAWNQKLWLVYSTASASDSDNLVFTGS